MDQRKPAASPRRERDPESGAQREALRSLGVLAQLVIYPEQHHGISKPTCIKDRYERYLAWCAKYLK